MLQRWRPWKARSANLQSPWNARLNWTRAALPVSWSHCLARTCDLFSCRGVLLHQGRHIQPKPYRAGIISAVVPPFFCLAVEVVVETLTELKGADDISLGMMLENVT